MQAILITAYKDFDYLNYLVSSLIDEEIYIFIHIDKQTFNKDIKYKLELHDRTIVISTRKIIWGSIEHLNAILDLLKEANEMGINFNYFHVITGQDYMWRSLEEFKVFFNTFNKNNYMSIHKVDKTYSFRYEKYFRNDVINYKSSLGNLITKAFYILQKICFIKKRIPNNYELYKGMVYVSITNEFANYLLDLVSSKEGRHFLKFLKWSFIPEEFFFQTVIMNSPYKNTAINNNKRYILWKEKYKSQPGILDIEDIADICRSDSFFIRKVDLEHSINLINTLRDYRK